MVRAATLAAVSASISTPVCPASRQRARMRTASGASACSSSLTLVSSSGWHSGISSWVRLAAWMPAIRATAKTSPLGWPPSWISCRVSGRMRTTASAVASREVTAFSVTSTMLARPWESRWVSTWVLLEEDTGQSL